MALLYFAVLTQIFRLIEIVLKTAVLAMAVLVVGKIIRRFIIWRFYKHITRVAIYGKKDIIIRESVPTGYRVSYHHVEHYKYVFKNVGAKYKTRVYFRNKFYIPYRFKDTDKLFQELLTDSDMTLEELKRHIHLH